MLKKHVVPHVERIYACRRVHVVDKNTFNVKLMHILDELEGDNPSWLAVPVNASNQPCLRPVVRLWPHHILEVFTLNGDGKQSNREEISHGSKN